MRIKPLIFFILLFSVITEVHSQQQFKNVGDLYLENGSNLKNCSVGYRTFGNLNSDSSNIVLYLSWFGGTSEQLGRLLGKNSFIDSTTYFVITIDALGNGISTSPSNYESNFPDITMRDMVNSQKKLMEFLGITQVHAIVGGSMGSMQVFEWLVAYPTFMKKAIPYVSTPKLSTYDLVLMNLQKQIIESGLKYGTPDKEIATALNLFTASFGRTPEKVNSLIPYDSSSNYIKSMFRDISKTFTIPNYLTQLKAMMSQNIYRHFDNSMDAAAKAIKADVHIIVSKTDLLINPQSSIEIAKLMNCEITILENNCGHLAPGCELKRSAKIIADFLEK
jgi:homoserine O-acetyltransferase